MVRSCLGAVRGDGVLKRKRESCRLVVVIKGRVIWCCSVESSPGLIAELDCVRVYIAG